MLTVKCFQIDQSGIVEVLDGEEQVATGIFPLEETGPGLVTVDFDGACIPVRILETVTDPAIVGEPAWTGQRRIYWRGECDE